MKQNLSCRSVFSPSEVILWWWPDPEPVTVSQYILFFLPPRISCSLSIEEVLRLYCTYKDRVLEYMPPGHLFWMSQSVEGVSQVYATLMCFHMIPVTPMFKLILYSIFYGYIIWILCASIFVHKRCEINVYYDIALRINSERHLIPCLAYDKLNIWEISYYWVW